MWHLPRYAAATLMHLPNELRRLSIAAGLLALTVPAAADDCISYGPASGNGTAPSMAPISKLNDVGNTKSGLPKSQVQLDGAATPTPSDFRARPGVTQIQGAFNGGMSATSLITNAVVVVTMLDGNGRVADVCNGVQYANGVVATNRHCFDKPHSTVVVDFGLLTPDETKNPDYHGEFRCSASRVAWDAPNGADVAVVRLAAVPDAYRQAVLPFDANGGRVGASNVSVNLTHYWMHGPDKARDESGRKIVIFKLTKYDQGPPSCFMYAPTDGETCKRGEIMHRCDTIEGSSGSPLYNAIGPQSRVAALNTGGVRDHANCAVPAADFYNDLPNN